MAWTLFGKEVADNLLDCEVAKHHTGVIFVLIDDQEALVHAIEQSQVVLVSTVKRVV